MSSLVELALKTTGRGSAARKWLAIALAVMVVYTAIAALVHAAHHRAECQASQGRDHPCFLYSFATGHAGAPSSSVLAILPPETLVVAVVTPQPLLVCAVDHRLSPSRAPPLG